MHSRRSRLGLACLVGLALAACGSDPGAQTDLQGSSSTSYGSQGYTYGSPTNSSGYPPSTTAPGYGSPTAAESPAYGSSLSGMPAASVGSPPPLLQGMTGSAPPSGQPGPGFTATITSKQTSGLFVESVTAVTVQVTNNDPQEESHFVIVSFLRNGSEVGVAYQKVDLQPQTQQTLSFAVPVDSSGNAIQADDATVAIQDSLL